MSKVSLKSAPNPENREAFSASKRLGCVLIWVSVVMGPSHFENYPEDPGIEVVKAES